jgi:hypothetical protein
MFFPHIKECYCHNDNFAVSLFLPNDYKTRVHIGHVAVKYFGLLVHSGTPHQSNNWFDYKEIYKPLPEYVIGLVTKADLGRDKF